MRASCVCGHLFFAEFSNCICPKCGAAIELITGYIDFNDYRQIMDDTLPRIKESVVKHGTWDNYSATDIHKAVSGEVNEYRQAVVDGQIDDKHGQIDELHDVICTAVKGIRRLKCLITPSAN